MFSVYTKCIHYRVQSCELLTCICFLNSDFGSWNKSRSQFHDQKYLSSPTNFFYIGINLVTSGSIYKKKVIKMADLLRQCGLSVTKHSAFRSLQPRSDMKTVAKSEQKSQRQFVVKWLKEFSWLALREAKMFCIVYEFASSLAGKTDFICSGCVSFKRDSLVLHNSKHSRPSFEKWFSQPRKIPYTGWPWLLTLLIVKMNNTE